MLTEYQIIRRVCRFLQTRKFRITQHLKETEKGIDIMALGPDGKTKVAIEAKGETSSMSHTARFGKPFSGSQVYDHVAKAFYCAVVHASRNNMAGIALPDNANHRKQVAAISSTLKTLKIEVFWVQNTGEVRVEGNWSLWANRTIERDARKNRTRPSP